MHTTRSDVCSMHSGSRHSLIELKHLRRNKGHTVRGRQVTNAKKIIYSCCGAPDLLSLFKHPEEGGHGTNVKGVCGDGHDVVQDASHLSVQNYEHNTFNHLR